MQPHLAYIQLFPIKSLDPLPVQCGEILPSGALLHDRRFAVVDDSGVPLTGKRAPRIQTIRSSYNLDARVVMLRVNGQSTEFHLEQDRDGVERWFSEMFHMPLRLVEDAEGGFPDDYDSPGPTVVSTATLKQVAECFALPLEEVRRRFRANLEVDGVEPFWEDRLYGEAGAGVGFRIGAAMLFGTNPCQRCSVPSRDSYTGEADQGFAKQLAEFREATLPAWAPRQRFDHFYRLATNTRPYIGGAIHIGDAVRLLKEHT